VRPSMSENLNTGGMTGVCGSLPIQNKHPGGQVFDRQVCDVGKKSKTKLHWVEDLKRLMRR
jgi:hypothetical protein